VVKNYQGEELVEVPAVDQYQLMVEHFGECIVEDKQPRYEPQKTLENMRLIDALYESARQRSWKSFGS
jgi:predicted dehydrogenase